MLRARWGGGDMEKPIEVKLIANIESIKESIDMLNELNEHLKRAKDLIDELAQKKAELELEVNSVSLGDYQGKFLWKYFPLKILNIVLLA